MTTFRENLETGQLGEGTIARFLRRRGWNVLPAYDVEIGTGKGPRLYTAKTGGLVAPDMLVFRDGYIRWVEAKTKSAFTFYRKHWEEGRPDDHCWQDGIDTRHWREYLKVADTTGWDVWIMFLHPSDERPEKGTPPGKIPPKGLFGNSIQHLRRVIDHTSDRHAYGMTYWKLLDLRRIPGWCEATEVVPHGNAA